MASSPIRWWILCSCLAVLIAGCNWANDEDDTSPDDEEDKVEEVKAQIELTQVAALPEEKRLLAKPGHWSIVRHTIKPNKFDFNGRFSCSCVDNSQSPIVLDRTPFSLRCTRPISLIKGQTKVIDAPIFIGYPSSEESKSIRVRPQLVSRQAGRVFELPSTTITQMLPYQYHFVVLSDDPDRYSYLKMTATVRPPADWWDANLRVNYLLTNPSLDEETPLPDFGLGWTSIAYLLWDNVDPSKLTPDQQTAMIDWLHWGGNLIISGPKSLELLRSGFLADYLPAIPGKSVNAAPERIRELSDFWSLEPDDDPIETANYEIAATDDTVLQIVDWEVDPQSNIIEETGDLVVERRVGRGRIVATAFSLHERQIVNWQGFDGFLNNCLLGRRPRVFSHGRDELPTFYWKGGRNTSIHDPHYSTQLRYFARDAATNDRNVLGARNPEGNVTGGSGFEPGSECGFGGWSDFNAVSEAARGSLVRAAGVSVPNADFVAKMLAAYLVCLVPLNWIAFRLLRRVEWAWYVAPVIAIAGAFSVVRLAQLDIGFVRSRTEIAVVETHNGYDRALVTRFMGLYTSLSGRYDIDLPDGGGLALPFSTAPSAEELRLASIKSVEYRRQSGARLVGVPVLSNSTGMIHCEDMVPLDGAIRIDADEDGRAKVINGTQWELESAILMRRDEDSYRLYLVGPIDAGAIADVSLAEPTSADEVEALLEESPITCSQPAQGVVSLRELFLTALNPRQLPDQGYRLVAFSQVELDGVEVIPKSSQQSTFAMIVANGLFLPDTKPEVDGNLVEDVVDPEEGLYEPLDETDVEDERE